MIKIFQILIRNNFNLKKIEINKNAIFTYFYDFFFYDLNLLKQICF